MRLEDYVARIQKELLTNPFVVLTLKCTPGSAKTEWQSLLDGEIPIIKLKVAAPPEKGKANSLITNFIQKEFNCSVKIVTGHTSSTKRIKLWKK